MDSSLLSVAAQILKDLQRTYSETNKVPDDLLIALRFVFGPCALQALDLVDQRSVTCVSSPSSQKAFQVFGGSGHLYTCFTSCHYCPCPAFTFSVLKRNESLMIVPVGCSTDARSLKIELKLPKITVLLFYRIFI
ncbi:zinc finger SWIM domain-containing protein 7 isoform X2 [Siphateles boraxobius]|uniref:zinc finger SWIM domain-containing protein 7 isoform X2 n=1 Tax=Siphateles boraxobius TaxID=180520 RepID=UPI0040648D0B